MPQMTLNSKRGAGVAAAVIALAGGIVAAFEGFVPTVYPDPVLNWVVPTACFGHTGPELRPGQQFTRDECEQMLHADLRETYDELDKCMPLKVSNNQLAAFLSLGFNTGAGAVCRSSIPVKVKAGNYAAACATITEFVYVGGLDCRDKKNNCMGIPRRRAAERALCETPDRPIQSGTVK
jgi:lysozyme